MRSQFHHGVSIPPTTPGLSRVLVALSQPLLVGRVVLPHPGLGTDFVFVIRSRDSRPHLREGLLEQFDIRAVHTVTQIGC